MLFSVEYVFPKSDLDSHPSIDEPTERELEQYLEAGLINEKHAGKLPNSVLPLFWSPC